MVDTKELIKVTETSLHHPGLEDYNNRTTNEANETTIASSAPQMTCPVPYDETYIVLK